MTDSSKPNHGSYRTVYIIMDHTVLVSVIESLDKCKTVPKGNPPDPTPPPQQRSETFVVCPSATKRRYSVTPQRTTPPLPPRCPWPGTTPAPPSRRGPPPIPNPLQGPPAPSRPGARHAPQGEGGGRGANPKPLRRHPLGNDQTSSPPSPNMGIIIALPKLRSPGIQKEVRNTHSKLGIPAPARVPRAGCTTPRISPPPRSPCLLRGGSHASTLTRSLSATGFWEHQVVEMAPPLIG